jgi:sugar-specific transcriptional regulator TrmB
MPNMQHYGELFITISTWTIRKLFRILRSWASGVQLISDQSGIKRVTSYVILESLVGLGLVSQSVKGKKTLFVAEDPTNLERLLQRRQDELGEQQQNLKLLLPKLSTLRSVPK